MYFSTALAAVCLLYALPSSAQDLSDLPSCAQTPTLQSIGSSGCQLTDVACICKNQKFIDSLTPQIQKACSPSDLAKVEQFTSKLCGSVGVSVALAPTSGAASATSAVSAAGSSASSVATKLPTASAASTNRGADVATSSVAATTPSSSSAADGGQVALLREGAISWCVSAIFLGVGGAWVLRGL